MCLNFVICFKGDIKYSGMQKYFNAKRSVIIYEIDDADSVYGFNQWQGHI